jgi:hypothetical protein
MVPDYIPSILRLYLQLPDTPDRARPADRKIATELLARQVPIETVESALLLATARRLCRSPDKMLPPVRCLAYYLPVIEEVLKQPLPVRYTQYLRGIIRSRTR